MPQNVQRMALLPWDLPQLWQFPARETSQAGLRAHVCTQARVSELAPRTSPLFSSRALALTACSRCCSSRAEGSFLGISASTEPSSPSLCQHSGESCSWGKCVGVLVVMGPYVCVPVPPVTPRASGDANEVLDGIPPCGAGAIAQPDLPPVLLSPCHCRCATTAEPQLRFAGL